MAVHKVFFGGNGRGGYERHSRVADATSDLRVRYEGLLLNRHHVLDFLFDAGLEEWRGYVEMEGKFEVGDELLTHWIGDNANIQKLVFHNKRESGVVDQASGNITTPTSVEVSFVDATGADILGTSPVTIDLSKTGRTVIDGQGEVDVSAAFQTQQLMTAENAYVKVKLTAGTLENACFSMFLDFVDFIDVRGCTCDPIPCETTYPDPLCPPGGLVSP